MYLTELQRDEFHGLPDRDLIELDIIREGHLFLSRLRLCG